jgi:hypothetical protein
VEDARDAEADAAPGHDRFRRSQKCGTGGKWRQVRASVGRCGMEHPRCRRESLDAENSQVKNRPAVHLVVAPQTLGQP